MNALTALIILALVATVVSLGLGIRSMMKGGEYDRKHSDQFMLSRIGFQALALILMVAALYVANW